VRIVSLPTRALALCAAMARPVSEATANQLSLLRVIGEQQTEVRHSPVPASSTARTRAADYLRAKAACAGRRA
jgi:hypothetical protein